MMNWDCYSSTKTFAGISNYLMILADEYFGPILKNTIIFGVGCTLLQQLLGILLAAILDKKFNLDLRSLSKLNFFILLPFIFGLLPFALLAKKKALD